MRAATVHAYTTSNIARQEYHGTTGIFPSCIFARQMHDKGNRFACTGHVYRNDSDCRPQDVLRTCQHGGSRFNKLRPAERKGERERKREREIQICAQADTAPDAWHARRPSPAPEDCLPPGRAAAGVVRPGSPARRCVRPARSARRGRRTGPPGPPALPCAPSRPGGTGGVSGREGGDGGAEVERIRMLSGGRMRRNSCHAWLVRR